ncbi:MAG: hypothetical protein OXD42_07605 [Rhodospirillaceae bacterium]|nr:hypothetical protein [Rhodospirillaceae bacterium]MCY4237141.1 hypothetical protein [Rhodospirillaceae bacterium]
MAVHVEELVLAQADVIARTVTRMADAILRVRSGMVLSRKIHEARQQVELKEKRHSLKSNQTTPTERQQAAGVIPHS